MGYRPLGSRFLSDAALRERRRDGVAEGRRHLRLVVAEASLPGAGAREHAVAACDEREAAGLGELARELPEVVPEHACGGVSRGRFEPLEALADHPAAERERAERDDRDGFVVDGRAGDVPGAARSFEPTAQIPERRSAEACRGEHDGVVLRAFALELLLEALRESA